MGPMIMILVVWLMLMSKPKLMWSSTLPSSFILQQVYIDQIHPFGMWELMVADIFSKKNEQSERAKRLEPTHPVHEPMVGIG
jgi:carbon starvation protein CstA